MLESDLHIETIKQIVASMPSRLAELAKNRKARPEGQEGDGYEFLILCKAFRAAHPDCGRSSFDAAMILASHNLAEREDQGDLIAKAVLHGWAESNAQANAGKRQRRATAGDALEGALRTGAQW
jgi:hypothetical protein